MATAVLANGHANGHVANGHDLVKIKSSAAKSRGALKRLKAKVKGKTLRGASESASEAGTESDVDVSQMLCDVTPEFESLKSFSRLC